MSPVLEIDRLSVTFTGRRSSPWTRRPVLRAVQDVSLTVHPRETVGLVGESGSGKTTVGRAVMGFEPASGGEIRSGGRGDVQMVFQDPLGSLNPAMSVGATLAEPVAIHDGLSGTARRNRTAELLDQVGLATELLGRYPHELSGGQRQRVAIARALAARPRLVVLDEPVSALDVSTQSHVIGLLERLQRDTGTSYLLIAHDLAVVRHASHRIAVMYRSRIVETGPSDAVCDEPCHPYTALLIASIPDPDPVAQRARRDRRRALATGTTTGAPPPDVGCPFAPRCPHAAAVCTAVTPEPTPTAAGGTVACHLHTPDHPAGGPLRGRPLAALESRAERALTSTSTRRDR